jgi:NitT/TauT family transport system ATP-binding protein/taurine transport system ATP-binding protein
MSTDYIEFKDISLTYPSVSGASIQALAGLDLRVNRGDFVCIVGPSGCGKSSLLRLLAGFFRPSSGSLLIDGKATDGPDSSRGMVFQQAELYPWLTVFGNVEFGPKMRGVETTARRVEVERCLRLVRLWDFKDAYPYELSGGMQQRAAIARVLANDCDLLLMDEPFGALDALTREHLQEELLSLWRQTGKTIIFVTHSVEEAVYLGTDVLVMTDRPGTISARFHSPFSRERGSDLSRSIKALPEFVRLREEVLSCIWTNNAG